MNNFNKIKAMNIDEMIDFLVNACRKNYCTDCKSTIRVWLEAESEEEQ